MLLISCKVTAQLICAFVSACAKSRFSHDRANMVRWSTCNISDSFVPLPQTADR